MKKYILFLILSLFFKFSFAQKDTSVYYLTNSGKQVSTRDSAQLLMVILPPDTSVDKNIFVVKGYYPNGKLRLIAGSLTHSLPLKLQGYNIDYFPNGHKKQMRNFNNGSPLGDIIQYYPNGRFYNKRTYSEEISEKPTQLFEECSDSTGNVLTQNGNGNWIVFNDDFSKIIEKGEVHNGLRDSVWMNLNSEGDYVLMPAYEIDHSNQKRFTSVQFLPEFPGGLDAFYRFLAMHIKYPSAAMNNNIQGRVVVGFVVEKNGTLTGIHIIKGIGGGCDEEAVRMMQISPQWKPAMLDGHPVRIDFSLPINFTLPRQ